MPRKIDPLLRMALNKAGGEPGLAAALGVSRQMVYRWTSIPERFAVDVERLYGIPREKIAPRMFEGVKIIRPRK